MNRDIPTSFKSILVLFDLFKNINQKEVQYLKQLYSKCADNFENCADFISSIALIKIEAGQIELSSQLKQFLLEQPAENEIKDFVLNKLLNKGNTYVWEYLKKFSPFGDRMIFKPDIKENLYYSNLRNLLIELEFIYYDHNGSIYEISQKYLPLFEDLRIGHKISPERLKKIIEEQEKIGSYAEVEILKYEKSRLSSREDLRSKIVHISLEDTSAGYDIKSFTIEDDNSVNERFIEVKAISTIEKKFFMSRNEVNKSRLYRQHYYLYLLPVLDKYKFDLKNLLIIQDPSSVIFSTNQWQVTCEQFEILYNGEN